MKTYRITAFILAVIMLAGALSACSASGKSDGAKADAPAAAPNVTRQEAQTVSSKYAYVADYIELPDGIDYVISSCLSDDKLFFAANVVSGQETYTDEVTGEEYSYDAYTNKLFCVDLETRECAELGSVEQGSSTDEDGWNHESYISAMAAGADNTVWLCRQNSSYRYNLPENFDPASDQQWNYYESGETSFEIVQLDGSGAQLKAFTLATSSFSDEGNAYISSFIVDANGYIYVGNWSEVLVLDQDGKLLFRLDTSDFGSELQQYSATQVGVYSYGETRGVKLIDPSKQDWGETIELPSKAYNFFPGSGEYDLYYEYNEKIYGYNAETGAEDKVVDWLECDMNSPESCRVLPDGRVLAVISEWDDDGNHTQIAILNRVAASEQTEKTVLTLACMYLDYNIRNQILAFNRSSSKYRIVVKDYSEFITGEEDSYENALTRLNTEILSGNLPDIILSSNLPVDRYAAKGMLLDLWEFIDADENISREDLMLPVLEAASTDGKLYSLAPAFHITTAIGMGKVVGEYDNWTLAEVKDAMTKLQDGATVLGESYTQETGVQDILAGSLSAFIDWESGTCSFDSQEFIDLLEFIKQFPESFDYENFDWETDYESDYKRMRTGRQLLTQAYLTDFGSLYVQYAALEDDACFVGLPTGETASRFVLSSPVSITTACADKDAAWAFVRSLLQEDFQQDIYSFPVVRKYFDAMAEKAMVQEYQTDAEGNRVLDENGEPIKISNGGYGFGNDEMYEIYAVTQEQYDDLMALINSITAIQQSDSSVLEIIQAVTPQFFAGEKTAEEAAKEIQNRVGLYVAEQS